MPSIVVEKKIIAVVLTGEFNPAIFHPAWLAQNELVAPEEAETVNEVICTNEVSTFVLDGVHMQVERQRFGLTTEDESKAVWLRDLTVGIFSILEHTPLKAIGFNQDIRYALDSEEMWHAIGDRLAPKPCWEGILESPGMLGVFMRGKRSDCAADRIDIRVQPAPGLTNGVYVGFNQHYNLATESRFRCLIENKLR